MYLGSRRSNRLTALGVAGTLPTRIASESAVGELAGEGVDRIVLFSRSKGLVGLDIGSSAMKLVELHEKKGEFWLQRLGVEPLSPEAIVDGSIMDSSLVVDALNLISAATGVKQ